MSESLDFDYFTVNRVSAIELQRFIKYATGKTYDIDSMEVIATDRIIVIEVGNGLMNEYEIREYNWFKSGFQLRSGMLWIIMNGLRNDNYIEEGVYLIYKEKAQGNDGKSKF